jgi:DNA-binding IclR family transcriptional regulator
VGNADEVAELRNEKPPAQRIMALLRTMRQASDRAGDLALDRQLSTEEIAEACQLKTEQTKQILTGLAAKGQVVHDHGNWSLPLAKKAEDGG